MIQSITNYILGVIGSLFMTAIILSMFFFLVLIIDMIFANAPIAINLKERYPKTMSWIQALVSSILILPVLGYAILVGGLPQFFFSNN